MADKELKSLNFGGEDTYFPLPIVTSEDNDKILAVVDGDWSATTPEELGYVNPSDATITEYDVMNGEIAYGPEGKITGTAPFNYIETVDGNVNYKLLNEVLLSADNCEDRTLSILGNEIVLDSMIVDITTEV
jgi:hypothetical protein